MAIMNSRTVCLQMVNQLNVLCVCVKERDREIKERICRTELRF